MRNFWFVLGACLALGACSTGTVEKSQALKVQPQQATAPANNPAAKYVEVAGLRIREKAPGKLEVTFAVINHSEADLGDLAMNVNLRTTASKPGDDALCSFKAKVPGLGPGEMKEVTVVAPSKLRVYELPDWQFLKSDFQITEPK